MTKSPPRRSLAYKFSKWPYIIHLVMLAICIPEFIIFDFTEMGTAKKAIIPWVKWPLLILCVAFWAFALFKAYPIAPKFRKPRIVAILFKTVATALLTFFTYTFGTLAIVCAAQLLNAALGDGREVMVHSTVEEFIRTQHSRGNNPESWEVKITDSTTGRTLYVGVEKPYEPGDPFSGKFKVGKFGWLYSR